MMKLTIDDLRFVLALDRLGSLAALAREENVTPPAVTKRLGQLEARLGIRLALRTTRRLQLTHEGLLLAQHATGVLEHMQTIEEALRQRSQAVAGKLKVHGPLGFGRRYLGPLLAQFQTTHPNLEVQLYLSDNLMLPRQPVHGRDAFDVLVSIGAIPDSRWVAHRIAPNRRLLCAAPEYLAKAPPLTRPADLVHHACLVLRENDEDVTLWRFAGRDGKDAAKGSGTGGKGGEKRGGSGVSAGSAREHTVRVRPAMESNDGDVVHQWCLAGKGIMARSEWDVADGLASGRLVALLPGYRLPDADVMALVPQSRVASMRTRLFVEMLRKAFGPRPPWRSDRRA
ncbi:LysR family transcriptional regulator [Cupriavidus gilardii]|uniref:LysR family transcriptional regulator n=2 Tax=Cupriavidus gilardii TaxID=82541 RepID=A0ABY4VL56_9BURK|nr:LysR family transcriptional regulator [Cupriavidus gilardii]USE77956.1 LysR family transcriptional regulator [Cupriavidus gilardii]